MRTELENLHGRFLLNLSFMQQCPVESIVNSMAGMERIKDGMCDSIVVYISANKGYGTQLFSFCFPEKGGERTGEDDLHSETSPVHSQLRVRGGC
jgi:hypothetical protein